MLENLPSGLSFLKIELINLMVFVFSSASGMIKQCRPCSEKFCLGFYHFLRCGCFNSENRVLWLLTEHSLYYKYLFFLTLSTLGKHLSSQHFGFFFFFFFFFFRKPISHLMQIVSKGDNLHEMSNPVFWEKGKMPLI